MAEFLVLLLALLSAHYIADFAMQNDFVANMKAKVHTDPHGWHCLIAHSVHHAALSASVVAAAGLIYGWSSVTLTAVLTFAVIFTSHLLIDYGKAVKNWYGIDVDQLLHILVILIVCLVI